MHWRAICPVAWHLEQMRFGHAFVTVTRRIPCNTLGNSRVLSHVRQSHSKRTPFFELNFPFICFAYAAAVTDPADGLPAAFRDPADGLSAAFLRLRCWTPNGRTGREQRLDDRQYSDILFFAWTYCTRGTLASPVERRGLGWFQEAEVTCSGAGMGS